MEKFNETIDGILNGTLAPDSDSEVGNFGALDASGTQDSTKIIIHLDSGVELHLPEAVVTQIVDAVNGPITPDQPEVAPQMAQNDEYENEESDEDEDEESDDEDEESDEDEDEDKNKGTALSEGCGRYLKKKKNKKLKKKGLK